MHILSGQCRACCYCHHMDQINWMACSRLLHRRRPPSIPGNRIKTDATTTKERGTDGCCCCCGMDLRLVDGILMMILVWLAMLPEFCVPIYLLILLIVALLCGSFFISTVPLPFPPRRSNLPLLRITTQRPSSSSLRIQHFSFLHFQSTALSGVPLLSPLPLRRNTIRFIL